MMLVLQQVKKEKEKESILRFHQIWTGDRWCESSANHDTTELPDEGFPGCC